MREPIAESGTENRAPPSLFLVTRHASCRFQAILNFGALCSFPTLLNERLRHALLQGGLFCAQPVFRLPALFPVVGRTIHVKVPSLARQPRRDASLVTEEHRFLESVIEVCKRTFNIVPVIDDMPIHLCSLDEPINHFDALGRFSQARRRFFPANY